MVGLQQVVHTNRTQGGEQHEPQQPLSGRQQHQQAEHQATQGQEKRGVTNREVDLAEVRHERGFL
jgi:hypothetical protein